MNFGKLNVRIMLYTQHFNVFLILEMAFYVTSCYYIFYTWHFYSHGLCLHLLIVIDLVFFCSLNNAVLNESLFHELDI